MKFISRLLVIGIGAAVCACHSNPGPKNCNPLGGGPGEDCFLPFPSSHYTRPDPASKTGLRVNLDATVLPSTRFGVPLDPAPYNERDGFSAAGPILAEFPQAIDPSSVSAQLLNYATGERVPLFVELDANAEPGKSQAVILRPNVRLQPRTRYVAVIQNLRSVEGRVLQPLTGFRALREGTVKSQKYDEIFAFLAHAGIGRKKLQLAWDFSTGSDEAVTGRLVKMRDDVYASHSAGLEIRKVEKFPPNTLLVARRLTGVLRVPSFLRDKNHLNRDARGDPAIQGLEEFPLTIHVPDCVLASGKPAPVVIYGHGTFNTARHEMSNPYGRKVMNRLCAIEVGTDWLGRAREDLPSFLLQTIPNWNHFPEITDRLQQAHINQLVLARLIREGALDRIEPLADRSRIYYYGISEGGCQGITTLALSPDIERGAFNVPCGFWSMFFWRSSDFHYTRQILGLSYPNPLDQQKLLALSQLLWDYTDPANYGAHVLHDPLPGSRPKQVLYQEGINDASVPNVTTRAMARTIGLTLLTPRVEAVEGIAEASGPLQSGYVQYDVGSTPRLGATNIPPPASAVHEQIRRLEAAQKQLQIFFERGVVEDTCAGQPCRFPAGK